MLNETTLTITLILRLFAIYLLSTQFINYLQIIVYMLIALFLKNTPYPVAMIYMNSFMLIIYTLLPLFLWCYAQAIAQMVTQGKVKQQSIAIKNKEDYQYLFVAIGLFIFCLSAPYLLRTLLIILWNGQLFSSASAQNLLLDWLPILLKVILSLLVIFKAKAIVQWSAER